MQFTAEIPDPKFEIGEEFEGGFGHHYRVTKRWFVPEPVTTNIAPTTQFSGNWRYEFRNDEGLGSTMFEWYLKKIPQNTEEAIR